MDYKSLGDNIRRYRKAAGLTQEALAEIVDCSTGFIGQIEICKSIPSLETTLAIANALGVTVDQLIKKDSDVPELTYFKNVLVKLNDYPVDKRHFVCDMFEDVFEVIDRYVKMF